MATLLRSASCALLLLPSLAFAGVLRVTPSGPYTTPQAAIDAAVDGDVVLIAPGTYPGFTIANKALAVGVDPTGTVQCGQARVIGLAAAKNVVLQDLSLHPTTTMLPAVELTSNAGSVRLQSCTIVGSHASQVNDSGPGLSVTGSNDVVLRGCTVNGGSGWWHTYMGYFEWTTPGERGVYAQGSRLALYGCSVTGGGGGPGPLGEVDGGDGGHGLETPDSFVLAERTTFHGGYGGPGGDGDLYIGGGDGGDGGHGAVLQGAAARLVQRQSTFLGGWPGQPGYMGISPGNPGQPTYVTAGAIVNAAQTDVVEVEAPSQWRFGLTVPVTVRAAPGTVLVLRFGADTNFAWNAPSEYALHVPDPCRRMQVGPIPPSGFLTIPFTAALSGSGVPEMPWYFQVERAGPLQGPAGAPACVILR